MDFNNLAHKISVRVAQFDLVGLKQIISEVGTDALIPVKLHTLDSELKLPLTHAIFHVAASNYLTDSALYALVKGLDISIDMPSPLNDLSLDVEYLNVIGLPATDPGYYQEGKLTLDRTLAPLERIKIELMFRRNKLLKHLRAHACPATFFASIAYDGQGFTLDDVLSGVKIADDRHRIRTRLMGRLAWVIRKPEHLGTISVREVVARAGLLSPHNPERFLFWAGMFEQLHCDEGASPVADQFLSFLLDEASVSDPEGCHEVLRHMRWDASVTNNHVMALDVFHARVAESAMSWIQDDITFQTNFALRNLKALADDDYGVLPFRMHLWHRRFVDHTPQVILDLMSSFTAQPITRHVHNYWQLIQELLDRGFSSNDEIDPELYGTYERHLLRSNGNTPDYVQSPATAHFCVFTHYDDDIDEHLTTIKAYFGLLDFEEGRNPKKTGR